MICAITSPAICCTHINYSFIKPSADFEMKRNWWIWTPKIQKLRRRNNWHSPPSGGYPSSYSNSLDQQWWKIFQTVQKFEQISFPPNISDLTLLFQVHWGPSWTPCSVDNHRFWGEFAAFFNLRPSDDQSSLRVQPKGRLEIFWTGSLEAWNEWTQRLWQPLSALDRGPVYLKNLVFLRNCKAFEPTRFVIRHQLTRYSQWK